MIVKQILLYLTSESTINIRIEWLKTNFNASWKNMAHESALSPLFAGYECLALTHDTYDTYLVHKVEY